jgi:hypothetical protein
MEYEQFIASLKGLKRTFPQYNVLLDNFIKLVEKQKTKELEEKLEKLKNDDNW